MMQTLIFYIAVSKKIYENELVSQDSSKDRRKI